jgi:hypothetical protein
MYTLLSGIYKEIFRKDEFCILILGLDNAGKTVRKSLNTSGILKTSKMPEIFVDIFGSSKDQIQQELQRPKSKQNHHNSGSQHREH